MADLISRKALLEELDKWINPCVNYDKSEFLSGIATAISEVEDAPAVDAAPVVHGRWVAMHYEGGILDGANCERCSNCGWDRFFDEPEIKSVFRYCPKCGALMNGGNDND